VNAPPAGLPLPEGAHLVLDRSVRSLAAGSVLAGGHPGRLLRLSPAGRQALVGLLDGSPSTDAARRLGRRLVDAGMAHPVAPSPMRAHTPEVTVVIPVRDRTTLLERCLASLGSGSPIVVVDDGSTDPAAVAAVCRRHGAIVVVRAVNGGPAAARNQALITVGTELVAFLDSDCVADPEWLDRLTGLFDDPMVGAVAPRVRPLDGNGSVLSRYLDGRSPLDMGPDPSPVGPGRRVRYVPTAALVVRRRALEDDGFDPDLQIGEDVDLVWRLVERGWQVRYQPAVEVGHHEPSSWVALLGRRFRYGTSAGPLSVRHPGELAPVQLRPWPTAAAVGLLAGQPRVAAAATLSSGALLARQTRPLGVPTTLALGWGLQATVWTTIGLARAATTLAGPVLGLAVAAGPRHRRLRRAALALAAVPPLVEWWQRRPGLDPLRWMTACLADDLSYGAGVWLGSIRSRTTGPLLPTVTLGSMPISRDDGSTPGRGPRTAATPRGRGAATIATSARV
jgi:mycofactocin system glycosyltransferase